MSADEGSTIVTGKEGRRCPICGKPPSAEADPFCSKRCADVDLHRWLSGRYAIPTNESDEPDIMSGDEG